MDNNVTIAIVAKALIGLMLVSGGIIAIIKGAQLYRDGVGLSPERTSVEIFKKVKVATSSVGAVLMLTAFGWGWLATTSLQRFSEGTIVVAGKIPFEPSQAELDSESKALLSLQANWLKANPGLQVEVKGGATAADGSKDVREGVAERRADVVKQFLVGQGISATRIYTFIGRHDASPSATLLVKGNTGFGRNCLGEASAACF